MKLVFLSNYYNHHQHSLSQALNRQLAGEFGFVSTSQMRQERRALGYGDWETPDYVHLAYMDEDSAAKTKKMIREADVVIAGAAPESMYLKKIREGDLVFRYTERVLKNKEITFRQRLHFVKTRILCNSNRNVYLLCAGAYTADDYLRHGCFRGKTYKWGYFPETRKYPDIRAVLERKRKNTILWVGRFLDWKHPEHALAVAARLKVEGIPFEMKIIGTGQMENILHHMAEDQKLGDCVHFMGSMGPEQVRDAMEEAGIFLFTSDRQEGWGAVLNEAMNSGCAVVANCEIGSVPFLLHHRKNGMIYPGSDAENMYQMVKYLLKHPEDQARLGGEAYRTITELWNGEVAAQRLLELTKQIHSGHRGPKLYEDGPCSPADRCEENCFLEFDEYN